MTTLYITDGPPAADVFMAALHAPNPHWRTPLTFTIDGQRVSFNWINSPTWMGEHSRFLAFTVKIHGHNFHVDDYDTEKRTGEITSVKQGVHAINLLQLIASRQSSALSRVQRSL